MKKSPTAREIKRYIRGGSPLGNGNCGAARSEAGMSRELCIVRTVRARKSARWVGVLEYRVPPVVYRGGCPLGMQLCVCVLFPYPRISTKTSHETHILRAKVPCHKRAVASYGAIVPLSWAKANSALNNERGILQVLSHLELLIGA